MGMLGRKGVDGREKGVEVTVKGESIPWLRECKVKLHNYGWWKCYSVSL